MASVQPVVVKGVDNPVMVMTMKVEKGVYYQAHDVSQMYVVMPGIADNLIKLPLAATVRDLITVLTSKNLIVEEIIEWKRFVTNLDVPLRSFPHGFECVCNDTKYRLTNLAYGTSKFLEEWKKTRSQQLVIMPGLTYYTEAKDLIMMLDQVLSMKTNQGDQLYTILRSVKRYVRLTSKQPKVNDFLANLDSIMTDLATVSFWYVQKKYNLPQWISSIKTWL